MSDAERELLLMTARTLMCLYEGTTRELELREKVQAVENEAPTEQLRTKILERFTSV